jgi:glycosyltransferase involved in cell wall biosynthesis
MERPSRLRVFVPLQTLPQPDENAGDRRFCALLELMARHHRVDVWLDHLPASNATDHYRSLLTATGANLLPVGWSSYAWALTSTRYHIGLFEFYRMAELFAEDFRRRQPGAVVVIDSVDVHFAREAAGAELGVLDPAAARDTATRELSAYRGADAVVVVSVDDARLLEDAGGIPHLHIVPLIIPQRERPRGPRPPELLFVGSFRHLPNADGIAWFMNEVWPTIATAEPDTTLTIVGGHPPPDVLAYGQVRGVTVRGYVADLDPLVDRAAVSIAPLRYGGGVKGKVVEALASGVPVVTTPAGAQGLPVRHGSDLVVADDAMGFAQGVLSLLRDPARAERIGAAGQQAAAFCSPDRVERDVDHMMRALVRHPQALRPRLAWLQSATMHTLGALGRRLAPK